MIVDRFSYRRINHFEKMLAGVLGQVFATKTVNDQKLWIKVAFESESGSEPRVSIGGFV
jgi:hypothetical protein